MRIHPTFFIVCGAFYYLRDAILRLSLLRQNVSFSEIIIGNFFCDIQQVMVKTNLYLYFLR